MKRHAWDKSKSSVWPLRCAVCGITGQVKPGTAGTMQYRRDAAAPWEKAIRCVPPAETTPAPVRAEAPKREAELIQTLRTERDGYRSQVQAARDAIAAQYNNADFVAVNFSVPHGANRTSYLIRDALAAVRDSMSCRHDCDRWHGGKHSWE